MTQPIISIKVHEIEDFIREVQERGITRVYRGSDTNNRPYHSTRNTYTAYDPDSRVFIKGSIIFPEITELERMETGRNYNAWDFGNTATCSPTSKRKFVSILRQLGVDKEQLKLFSSVKVDELHKLIDSSELEEGGADSYTVYKKGGELVRKLTCNFMEIIGGVKAVIKKDYNSMTYSIHIEFWDKIYDNMCEKHETALVMNGLEVVGGEIEVK